MIERIYMSDTDLDPLSSARWRKRADNAANHRVEPVDASDAITSPETRPTGNG